MQAAARESAASNLTTGQINRIVSAVRRESAASSARVRGK